MSIFGSIWGFLKGKKTKIGGALHVAGKIATALGKPQLGEALEHIGTVAIAVGLTDQAVDSTREAVTGEPPDGR
jgi:hypothetical protein